MISLANLQHEMQDCILGKYNTMADHIKKTDRLTIQEKLNIYCQSYLGRLTQSLAEDFPALSTYMGEDIFAAMIVDFLKSHPSSVCSLDEVGLTLINFLSDCAFIQPYYIELTKFEWALKQVSLAMNQAALQVKYFHSLTELQSLAVKFNFVECVQLFNSDYEVVNYYDGIQSGERVTFEEQKSSRKTYVIWRNLFKVIYTQLDERQIRLFRLFNMDLTLDDITTHVKQALGESEATRWLPSEMRLWIDRAVFKTVV